MSRINCRRLWRIWNLLFIVIVYIFSIYYSIKLYISFKHSSIDISFGYLDCHVFLDLFLGCIIAALTLISFSLICLITYTNNIANDGLRFGRDHDVIVKLIYSNSNNTDHCKNQSKINKNHFNCFMNKFKHNFLPFFAFFHILSAFSLLIPLPFIEAQQIKQNFVNEKSIWHSDLDFIFDPDQSDASQYSTTNHLSRIWLMRPQFFNLIVSLLSLSLHYPSVFWFSNKAFSFVFSLVLITASVHIVFDYSTACVLIRVVSNSDILDKRLSTVEMLSPKSIMILSICGSLIMLLSTWTIFEYGWLQYAEYTHRYTQQHYTTVSSLADENSTSSVSSTCCKRRNHLILRGYLPHLLAILTFILAVGLKIPLLIFAMKTVKKYSNDLLIMSNFIVFVVLCGLWIMTWFGFTLKPNLKFYIPHRLKGLSEISSVHNHSINTMQLATRDQINSPNGTVINSTNTNPIYACFHTNSNMNSVNNFGIDGQQYLSDDTQGLRNFFGEESDIQNTNATANYVYLQSTMNPAMQLVNRNESPYVGVIPVNNNNIPGNNNNNINNISESESSYDSANNFRSKVLIGDNNQNLSSSVSSASILRNQTINSNKMNSNVLKYSAMSSPQNQDYIPMHSHQISSISYASNETSLSPSNSEHQIVLENNSSETNNNKSNYPNSKSLQRQNSAKKKLYGQRVTFKDEEHLEQSTIVPASNIDRSPNNSEEQDSNNTTSSDSGIDSNSRNNRILQMSAVVQSTINNNQSTRSVLTPQMSPPTNHSFLQNKMDNSRIILHDNTYYNFYSTSPSTISSKTVTNENETVNPSTIPTSNQNDTQSTLSFVTETDQERLCSQV